jgi:hypothetical protein
MALEGARYPGACGLSIVAENSNQGRCIGLGALYVQRCDGQISHELSDHHYRAMVVQVYHLWLFFKQRVFSLELSLELIRTKC